MVAVSERLNPECTHHVGDMRTVRLDREFDAVFVHDCDQYMTTEDDLRQAVRTAYAHCRPGGVAVLVPDLVDNFASSTDCGGHDGPDGRGVRYLSWTTDPDPPTRPRPPSTPSSSANPTARWRWPRTSSACSPASSGSAY